MSEKTILVMRSSMPPLEEYINEIKDMWETHWLTNMGPKHMEFQERLKEYLKVENIELLTNGHMALELTLQAFDLHGEVITTPFTFASTVHAIVRNGLKPVFCDIDPVNYTIDVTKLEALITPRTCAILPVHVYGNICQMEEIDRIAKKHHLKVIYDAAHTFGETYKGEGIGNFGDASCFSFHATKVFHSIEGGAVTFRDVNLGSILYDLKNFGIHGAEEICSVGANAKMNEFCAAMGLCNLRHIDEEILKRSAIEECYRAELDNIAGVTLNTIQREVRRNHAYFPVLFDKKEFGASRDDVYEALKREGIYGRKYFYPLANTYTCYEKEYGSCDIPVAESVSERVITLPMYADLEKESVLKICNIIKNLRK